MDSRIMNEIEARYASVREKNSVEEERRIAEITEKLPEVIKIRENRGKMIFNAVRTGCLSGDPEQFVREANEKARDLLVKAGYPPNYLEPIYTCAVCEDTGYYYDGNIKRVCDCFQKVRKCVLIPFNDERDPSQTFEAFDETVFPVKTADQKTEQRTLMRIAKLHCERYAEQLDHGEIKNMLIYGSGGLGKSYLMNCVVNRASQNGISACFVTAYQLLQALREAYFNGNPESVEEYMNTTLLAVDDLGMEPQIANVTAEQFYNLFSTRFRHGLYTIVTTNLSPEGLRVRYSERVTSRLMDLQHSEVFQLMGQDVRLMKKG